MQGSYKSATLKQINITNKEVSTLLISFQVLSKLKKKKEPVSACSKTLEV